MSSLKTHKEQECDRKGKQDHAFPPPPANHGYNPSDGKKRRKPTEIPRYIPQVNPQMRQTGFNSATEVTTAVMVHLVTNIVDKLVKIQNGKRHNQ